MVTEAGLRSLLAEALPSVAVYCPTLAERIRVALAEPTPPDRAPFLQEELDRVRKAIQEHRDARGHERCWLNDVKLYDTTLLLLDPSKDTGAEPPPPALPPRGEFLAACAAYYEGQTGCPSIKQTIERALGVEVGRRYWHYKTKGVYKVLAIGKDEPTLTQVVVYQSEATGEVWVRALSVFTETVIHEDGGLLPRFVPL